MKGAKAMLDSLMGPGRDKSRKEQTGEDFKEDNVCKYYLLGFCPNKALGRLVATVEPCSRLHSVAMRTEFEKHAQSEKYRREYEDNLLKILEAIGAEADAQGTRERRKCRPTETIVKIPEHLKQKIQMYEDSRKEALKDAEDMGSSGDIDGSKNALRSAETCQREIDGITTAHTIEFPGEEVCKECGVRFLKGQPSQNSGGQAPDRHWHLGYEGHREGDVWEEEHMGSKLHAAFKDLRAKLAELREKTRQRREEEVEGRGRERAGGERRRERSRRRSRSRERGSRRSPEPKPRAGAEGRGSRRSPPPKGGGDRSRSRDRRSRSRDRRRRL